MSALQIRSAIERHAALLLVPLVVTPVVAVVVMLVSEPVETRLIWVALAAAAVGLLIGVLAVYLADRFDPIVRSARDLKVATRTAVLAVIPTARGVRGTRARPVVALDAPASAYAERYRMLLAAMDFAHRDRGDDVASDDPDRAVDAPSPVLLVASARQGERKTTTAANLAVTAARTGRRVVLVDGDLRSPQLHRVFELDDDVGLTSVVTRSAPLQESAHRIDGLSKLMVMPVGPAPQRPDDVLNDDRLPTVVDAIARAADLVVIDAPPMLAAADAILWAQVSDSVLVVATAGTSDQRELQRVVDQLETVDATIVGSVLHQPDPEVDGARAVSYGSRRATIVSNAPRDWFIAEGAPAEPGSPVHTDAGDDARSPLAAPGSTATPVATPTDAPSAGSPGSEHVSSPDAGGDTTGEPSAGSDLSADVSVTFDEPTPGDLADADATPSAAPRPAEVTGSVAEGPADSAASIDDDTEEPIGDAADDEAEPRWPFPAPPQADQVSAATDTYSWGRERTGGVGGEGAS